MRANLLLKIPYLTDREDCTLALIEKTVEKMAEPLKLMTELENRITECEKRCKDKNGAETVSGASSQVCSEASQELLSRVTAYEMTIDDRIGKLESKIMEIGDNGIALGIKFEELKSEFPASAETRAASVSAVKELAVARRDRRSGMEILETTKDSVLV